MERRLLPNSRGRFSFFRVKGWHSATITCLLFVVSCGDRPERPRLGQEMPVYGAFDLNGAERSLDELRGQVVLLNVWATWCLPCRDEIPALQAIHVAKEAQGLVLLGVSIDGAGDRARIRSFLQEYGATYTIWHDPSDRIGRRFDLIGVPVTYLIDRAGVLRWQQLGPVDAGDGTLLKVLDEALARPG